MEKYINEETIIEDEFYQKFKELIICPLCLNIFIKPVMCLKCQNVYCQKCVDDWSKKDEKCPNRCIEPNYQRSLAKNQLLSTLKFKCTICGESIDYDQAEKHHDFCINNKDRPEINIKSPDKLNIIWDYIKLPKMEKIPAKEVTKLRIFGNKITHITGK